MNEETNKTKLKLEDLINEIDILKRYTKKLTNNVNGKVLEDYVYKLEKDIIKTQIKLESIHAKNNK